MCNDRADQHTLCSVYHGAFHIWNDFHLRAFQSLYKSGCVTGDCVTGSRSTVASPRTDLNPESSETIYNIIYKYGKMCPFVGRKWSDKSATTLRISPSGGK